MLFILAKHFKPIDTDSFLFNSPTHNPYQKTGLVDQKDMFYGYVSPEKNIFCSGADGIIKDRFGVSFIKNWKYESKKITFTREFEGGIQGADYTLELHKNYLWSVGGRVHVLKVVLSFFLF